MSPESDLDLDAVRGRLEKHVRLAGSLAVESSSTAAERERFLVSDGAQRWVVRRALTDAAAERLSTETELLEALADAAIPVPMPVVRPASETAGAFDVVTYVSGLRINDRLPAALPRTSSTRHDISAGMVDVLIRLHNLEPDEIGVHIGEIATPEQRLADLESRVAALGADSAPVRELVRRLRNSIPPTSGPAVVHGAFHVNRLIVEADDPRRVAGIVGWGGAVVDDPLVELGVLLALWAEEPEEPVTTWLPWTSLTTDDGFFSRSTVTHEYMVRSRHDLRHLEWYVELGYLALVERAAASGEQIALSLVDAMAEQAVERANHSGISGLAGNS